MKVACLNNISELGLNQFPESYQLIDDSNKADLILVRSFNMHEFPVNDELLAVARAGAGVNNIPLEEMADRGVVVFNTPGANSNSVKELVIAGMLLASRDIYGGIKWVKEHSDDELLSKSVEKAKKAFAGNEILGKTILVIGLGAVGGKVANACSDLGLKVYGYDPYISEKALKELKADVELSNNLSELYPKADFISLHLPLLDSTREMFDEAVNEKLKTGVVVLNFSRDLLVKDSAMKAALDSGKIAKYVTDFPNYQVAGLDNVIPIPHLGASTSESEDNCAIMAAKQLIAYVENGDIINSVNFPNVSLGKKNGKQRLIILSKKTTEEPDGIETILRPLESYVKTEVLKRKNDYLVQAIDYNSEVPIEVISALEKVPDVLRVRLI